MITLLACGGWGLFIIGALVHVRHRRRLADLLVLHTRHADALAPVVVALELVISIGLVVTWTIGFRAGTVVLALAGLAIGLGFVGWVSRLLLSDSDLPCACSFSSAPTTIWSLVRSAATLLVGLAALAPDRAAQPGAEFAATLLAGLAVAAAIYVLPESLSWHRETERLRLAVREQLAMQGLTTDQPRTAPGVRAR